MTWHENDIDYIMGVFPNFDECENISSWSINAVAWYDFDGKRFYIKEHLAEKITLKFIAENIDEFFVSGYDLIRRIPKSEIPFAVDLK